MSTTEAARAPAFQPAMRESVGTSRRTPGWNLANERRIDDGETLARGLGWFSIGLGLAELTAGRTIARGLGVQGRASVVRLFGVREIVQGVGILRSPGAEGWILARIAGDVLDLAALSPGLSVRNRRRDRVRAAVLAVAGATALDLLCVYQLRERRRRPLRAAAPASGSGGREEEIR